MYAVNISDSINRILKTPLGSRTMRPEFGSRLYELIDRDFDEDYKLNATRYVFEALEKFEPRITVYKVDFKINPVSGVVSLVITITQNEADLEEMNEATELVPVQGQTHAAVIGASGNPIVSADGQFILVEVTND